MHSISSVVKSVYQGMSLGVTYLGALSLFIALLQVSHAQPEFPNTLSIGSGGLVLNGSGVRKKAFISLYRCALYLDRTSDDAAKIVSQDAAMAIRIVIKSGFISSEKMQTAMEEGFNRSTGGDTVAIDDEIELFTSGFSDEIVKQDTFDLVYQPQKGVEVIKNGESKVSVDGLVFKQALFGIWLSDDPVQESLKVALLSSE